VWVVGDMQAAFSPPVHQSLAQELLHAALSQTCCVARVVWTQALTTQYVCPCRTQTLKLPAGTPYEVQVRHNPFPSNSQC
jgi:hypothetical protein